MNTTLATQTDTIFQTLWDSPASVRGFFDWDADWNLNLWGVKQGKITIINIDNVPGLGKVCTFHTQATPQHVWTALVEPSPKDGALKRHRFVRLTFVDVPRNEHDRWNRHTVFSSRLSRQVFL